MKILITSLFFISFNLFSQKAEIFRIDSIPTQGILLDKGWKWQAGDNPDFAKPDFNDSKWERIDPSKDIMDLPQVRKAGIGWLRLNLHVDSTLLQRQAITLLVSQVASSVLYSNGQLILRLGTVSPNADEVDAVYTAFHSFGLPGVGKSNYVLAVRIAFQPNLPYTKFANIPNFLYRVRVFAVSQLDPFSPLSQRRYNSLTYTFVKAGLFFILALLHLCFFIFYPLKKANLFFSISSLLFFLHWLVLGLRNTSLLSDLDTMMYVGQLRAVLYPINYIFLVTALYTAYALPKSYIYWAGLGACGLLTVVYFFNYQSGVPWIEIGSTIVMTAEAIRITIVAVVRKHRGVNIILIGLVFSFVGLSMRYLTDFTSLLPYFRINGYGNTFDNFGVLSLPLFFSVYLASEFAFASKSLAAQLVAVKQLSAQTLAQEQEKQLILSSQNETLEKEVAERTSELVFKNRDLEIEGALEKVRSRTMGMQKTDELFDTAEILYHELFKLGIESASCGFALMEEETGKSAFYALIDGKILKRPNRIPTSETKVMRSILESWKRQEPHYLIELNREETLEHESYVAKYAILSLKEYGFEAPFTVEEWLEAAPKEVKLYSFNFKQGYFLIITDARLTTSHEEIAVRFTKVFEQTYTRFLDLQKAEEQAREAQIETALERIRSRSMGMQKSEELKEVIKIVYLQLIHLKIKLDHAGFVVDYKLKGDWTFWIADELDIPAKIMHPYFESVWANQFNEAKANGINLFATYLNFEEKNKFYNELLTHIPELPQASKDFYLNCPGLAASTVLLEDVGLYIENFTPTPYTDKENKILLRFGKVFQQSYTRFLDLQNAEAQTKEAQIEAALEKARTRSMSMQSSDELPEVANVLFLQIQALGIPAWSCGYNILAEDKKSAKCCMSSEGTLQTPFKLRLFGEASFAEWGDFIYSEKTMFVQELGNKALEEHYAYMKSFPDLKPTFDQIDELGLSLPTYQINHLCKFTQGFLLFITYEKVPNAHDIFKRFTKVFEQTYTRFLDLQKAEAQAREAQIELALERVRAKTMAMQQSNQLKEIVGTMLEQLQSLGFTYGACSIVIMDAESGDSVWWISGFENEYPSSSRIPYVDHPFYLEQLNPWKEGKKYEVMVCEGESKKIYDKYIFSKTEFVNIPIELQKIMQSFEKITFSNAYMKHGALSWSTEPLAEEHAIILQRFAAVFEQSYTRFLDLQKAEEQAREAQIEVALERVRSKTLAMQSSDELSTIIGLIYSEMGKLNVQLQRCFFMIFNPKNLGVTWWMASGESLDLGQGYFVKYSEHPPQMAYLKGWQERQEIWKYVMHGEEKAKWDTFLFQETELSNLPSFIIDNMKSFKTIHLDASFNSFGCLTAGNEQPLPNEALGLLVRFSKVFELTYTRFNDIIIAEANSQQARLDLIQIQAEKKRAEEALFILKSTQAQLIQSEKLASLGELTAGIAHEIQNPLNFVNNFSEVSSELVIEMKEELATGNVQFANEIADDLKQNLEKITLHGKRASSIVKGMLEHSRASTGVKELTDINALAEEYLRLAYHGLRAKDPRDSANKSFNSDFKTDFDPNLPKIEVIPQDMGRVLLNLINNAFYAVKSVYKPMVVVTTKKVDNQLIISVKDNGIGMTNEVRAKIFQPFFTTKPTGQGTDLGLSLAYDIVKAHGGELKVETREGEGSEFIIIIPTVI